jgi:transcriptional regulator with XRE-family HTH domain
MALFFDAAWFDERLKSLGLSRGDLGTALGLTEGGIAELWKDQRELRAHDVRIIAALLGSAPAEIAEHAGISTPVPKDDVSSLAAILQRLERIETTLAELKALVHAMDSSKRHGL